MRKLLLILPIITLLFSQVELSLDGANLNYTSTSEVAGFQFDHDGCVTGASGGETVQAADFSISASSTVVLGFSFSGASLSAGEDVTLLTLEGDITEECLSGFIFSASGGEILTSEWAEPQPS
jgi:hypothetical protein